MNLHKPLPCYPNDWHPAPPNMVTSKEAISSDSTHGLHLLSVLNAGDLLAIYLSSDGILFELNSNSGLIPTNYSFRDLVRLIALVLSEHTSTVVDLRNVTVDYLLKRINFPAVRDTPFIYRFIRCFIKDYHPQINNFRLHKTQV